MQLPAHYCFGRHFQYGQTDNENVQIAHAPMVSAAKKHKILGEFGIRQEQGHGSMSKLSMVCGVLSSRTTKSCFERPLMSLPGESRTVTGTTTRSTRARI